MRLLREDAPTPNPTLSAGQNSSTWSEDGCDWRRAIV